MRNWNVNRWRWKNAAWQLVDTRHPFRTSSNPNPPGSEPPPKHPSFGEHSKQGINPLLLLLLLLLLTPLDWSFSPQIRKEPPSPPSPIYAGCSLLSSANAIICIRNWLVAFSETAPMHISLSLGYLLQESISGQGKPYWRILLSHPYNIAPLRSDYIRWLSIYKLHLHIY